MTCQFCFTSFTPNHGNERYCSEECRMESQKTYMRQYQRKQRGTGKIFYKLMQAGNQCFFVLPTRYRLVLQKSQTKWYSSIQEGLESFIITIAQVGTTPLCLTGSQYRVYLDNKVCTRFNLLSMHQQWGITFSAIDDTIIAIVGARWKPQENHYGRKNNHCRQSDKSTTCRIR